MSSDQALSMSEVKERLEIAERILDNVVLGVEKEAFNTAKEMKKLDFDTYLKLEDYLNALDQNLRDQYYDIVEEVIAVVFDKYYIDTSKMDLKAIHELYESSGFGDWETDECAHFGFVRVVHDNEVKNALIFTCSDLFKYEKLKLDVAVEGEVVD